MNGKKGLNWVVAHKIYHKAETWIYDEYSKILN